LHCRPLPWIGTGVWEIRDQDQDTWFRVVYLPRKNDVVYVLHVFRKNTPQMAQSERRTILERFKNIKRHQAEIEE